MRIYHDIMVSQNQFIYDTLSITLDSSTIVNNFSLIIEVQIQCIYIVNDLK